MWNSELTQLWFIYRTNLWYNRLCNMIISFDSLDSSLGLKMGNLDLYQKPLMSGTLLFGMLELIIKSNIHCTRIILCPRLSNRCSAEMNVAGFVSLTLKTACHMTKNDFTNNSAYWYAGIWHKGSCLGAWKPCNYSPKCGHGAQKGALHNGVLNNTFLVRHIRRPSWVTSVMCQP